MIARAREAGIERILVPGWDLPSSVAALALAERHGPSVQAAVGVHPHHAAELDEPAWAHLEELAADPRCAAIGEIGLDHFRMRAPREIQAAAFSRQLDLARRLGLPAVVHDREAHEDVTTALLGWPGRAMLHAFSGDAAMARALVAAGHLLSFALPVAFRSATGPRDAARGVAAGSYLVETDAPYLGPDRDARNEPTTALRVVAELARIRDEAPETVAADARTAYDRLLAG